MENHIIDLTPFYLRKRYLIIFLAFLGHVNLYTMRVNMSVAIVALTENRTVIDVDGNVTYEQEFDWSSQQKGYALSAFFYGYITTQLLGGTLATKFGGHLIFGVGILGTSIMTLFTPLMCYQGIVYLFIARVLEGMFSGISFPATSDVYAKWSPPWERTRTSTYSVSGIYVGPMIGNLVSGWLGSNYGWEYIFYVFGFAAAIWSIIWLSFVRSEPAKDPWMSKNERNFIIESLKNENEHKKVQSIPWKEIFTSIPLYAIAIAHFSYNWGNYTMLTQIPLYMSEILGFDLTKSGFFSAMPYLLQLVVVFVAGYAADFIMVRNLLSITQIRKYFNTTGCLCSAVALLIATFVNDVSSVIACLSLSVGISSIAVCGFLANPIDLAPQFSSIIMGISNTFATLPGLISPIVSGFIATTPSAGEYRVVFFIVCGIYLIGVLVYGFFASANTQSWAEEDPQENNRFKSNNNSSIHI